MAARNSNNKKITIPRKSNQDSIKKKSITISQLPKFPDQGTTSDSESGNQSKKNEK